MSGITYICEDCGFLFCRVSRVTECPFCEKIHIRPATSEENEMLRENLERQDGNEQNHEDEKQKKCEKV